MTDYDSLHVIGSRPSGGAERFYVRLVRALAGVGHRVLAVNQPGSAVAAEIGSAVPQRAVRMRGVWDPLARAQLARLSRVHRPAVVQSYMGRATRLIRLRREGATAHVARLGGFYDVAGYRHAHAWVGNTRGICDYLVREGLAPRAVHHIGNFVDPVPPPAPAALAALRSRFGVPADALAVVFVGRLHPNKGVADLLQAFAAVPVAAADRPIHLVIAGDGPLATPLQVQSAQLGLSGRVHWTGWLDDPGGAYAIADLCVCPSVHEPLGNVVLEAWAHRKAVLATRSQGPLELLTDGENGVLVPIADPGRLADALRTLLRDGNDALSALGTAGARSLEQDHSEAQVVAAYRALYASL